MASLIHIILEGNTAEKSRKYLSGFFLTPNDRFLLRLGCGAIKLVDVIALPGFDQLREYSRALRMDLPHDGAHADRVGRTEDIRN